MGIKYSIIHRITQIRYNSSAKYHPKYQFSTSELELSIMISTLLLVETKEEN